MIYNGLEIIFISNFLFFTIRVILDKCYVTKQWWLYDF